MAAGPDVRSDASPNLVLVHGTALYARYPVVRCTQMHKGVGFQRAALTAITVGGVQFCTVRVAPRRYLMRLLRLGWPGDDRRTLSPPHS